MESFSFLEISRAVKDFQYIIQPKISQNYLRTDSVHLTMNLYIFLKHIHYKVITLIFLYCLMLPRKKTKQKKTIRNH